MHPFLAPDFHIRWSTLVPDAVEADIRTALDLAKSRIAAICAVRPESATFDNTFGALESACEELNRGWGRLNHLDSVADEPKQREALNHMLPEVSEFFSSIPLNADLWNALKAFGESPAAASLPPVLHRLVTETMEEFRQSGADLPDASKTRAAEIDAELSKLTKEYAEHVLDSTNAWETVIRDEAQLAGLPTSARAAALASARAKGIATDDAPAWRFTLHLPSMLPVMQYLEDDSIRRTFWEASVRVAADAPHDNTQLVRAILRLRQEKAALLGCPNFADLTLSRRMAGSGQAALSFIEDLHRRVHAPFLREYAALRDYKAATTNTPPDDLQPWETAYWSERQRRECYDLDDEDLRPYFPVTGVMDGMFRLASELFGITIRQLPTVFLEPGSPPPADGTVEVWHPEVTFYDLLDSATGDHLGSFYADWHPRESKRGGAWMNSLETGCPPSPGIPRQPHLGLIIGNMSPPVDGKPALLTHNEVETIFHEFGHLLHGLLSEVPVKSLAGTNVPWDFVELPSQIMENFCWDRRSLDLFARHHITGGPIPEELYQRMLAAKNYQSATTFIRQLAFGRIDLELHMRPNDWIDRDLDEADREILADYRAPLKTDTPSMIRRFNHLFSSPVGYAAGYYSYKWAEVLDADAFTRFAENGVVDATTGRAFRNEILSKGNSAPADQLYRNFMGRDPLLDPLLVRSGLA